MKLPFHKKPRIEIVPVGNENTGILYFKKIWGRSGTERAFVDELEFQQGRTQLKLLKLARKIVEETGKTAEEALELIATNSGESTLLNYLEEIEELLELRNEEKNTRDKIVTLMINGRVAYPVTFVGANQPSETLEIEHNSALQAGEKIKVTNFVLELAESITEEDTEIKLTKKNTYYIAPNSVGFLVDDKNNYQFGNKDWKLENTQNSEELNEQLKDAIFEFYQLESIGGELPSTQKKEPLRNESKASKNTQVEPSQTGKKSSTNSSATESQPKDSTKVLETV